MAGMWPYILPQNTFTDMITLRPAIRMIPQDSLGKQIVTTYVRNLSYCNRKTDLENIKK